MDGLLQHRQIESVSFHSLGNKIRDLEDIISIMKHMVGVNHKAMGWAKPSFRSRELTLELLGA